MGGVWEDTAIGCKVNKKMEMAFGKTIGTHTSGTRTNKKIVIYLKLIIEKDIND